MTDFKKTIFLEIDIDNSDAERRMAQLTQDIDKLKEANKSNTKETQAQRVEFEKNNVAIKSAQQEYNNLKTTLVNNTNAAKANKGSYTELYNQWKAAEAQLKNMAGAFKTNENGITELTQEYHDQSKAVDDLKKNLLLFNAGISQGNLNVGNYGNTLEGMRNQLQQMRLDLEKLEVGSVAFTEMKEKIDGTSTSIQIAEGKIDSMGQKIAKNSIKDAFNDIRGAAQGLTGAIGILSLGFDSQSKTGEILRSAMISLTVAQTALTIAEQKDDLVKIGLTIKTKALAAAQWALNNAVKAFGIAGAITGLGFFISKLIGTKEKTDAQTDSQGELNKELDKTVNLYKEISDQMKSLETGEVAEQIRQIERVKVLRKEQGASEIELLQIESKLLKAKLVELQNIEDAMNSSSQSFGVDALEVQQDILDAQNAINANYVKLRKAQDEELLKSRQSATEAIEPISEFISNQEILVGKLKPLLVALYGEDVVNGVLDYTDALGDEEIVLKGVQTATENLAAADAAAAAEAAARLKRQQDIMYATIDLSRQMGAALADVLTDSEDKIKDYNKQVLLITIKAIKSQIDLAISATIAREIGTKGFAGIVTGAILTGLIEAAFGVAINSLEGFATGGKITGGTPINRSNGDNVLITAKTGEVIMNENQQRKLQAVAGRDVFSKLGIPGFDTGGAIGTGISTTVNSSLSLSEMRSLNNMLRNQPAPVVVYKEFTDFKQRVEYAEQAGSLV